VGRLLLFLSHINEEAELANLLKLTLESAFLGLVNVFVSSSPASVLPGARWLEEITDSLKSCAVELVLCSPESVTRPWVNFEAGAGWIRDVKVIPLCHSGMSKSELPIPLNLLQAAHLSDVAEMADVFGAIAAALGSGNPAVDLATFRTAVVHFEEDYTFWSKFRASYTFGASYFANSPYAQDFISGKSFDVQLTETQTKELAEGLSFLIARRLLAVERVGGTSVTTTGTFYGMRIAFRSEFGPVLTAFVQRSQRRNVV